MNERSEPSGPQHSDDQRAVAEYFASERYQRRKVLPDFEQGTRRIAPTPFNGTIEPGLSSLIAGLFGLAMITLCFAVAMPIAIKLLNHFNVAQPKYVLMMFMVQSILFPPIVSFAFTTVTPMFWYGSIVVRFILAILSVLPGCTGFVVALYLLDEVGPDRFYFDFTVIMFSAFFTSATVALTVQIWSRWTVTHARIDASEPLPSPGIRSMIELTAIAALGCAVAVSVELGDLTEGILFFSAIGLFASIAIISVLIAFLRVGCSSRRIGVIAFLFAFGASIVNNSFFAAMEYGWEVLAYEIPLIALASVYGAILISFVMWLCLWWLRCCGWRCLHQSANRRDPASGDDWVHASIQVRP